MLQLQPMILSDMTFQGELQLIDFIPQPSLGQFGQLLRILVPDYQGKMGWNEVPWQEHHGHDSLDDRQRGSALAKLDFWIQTVGLGGADQRTGCCNRNGCFPSWR